MINADPSELDTLVAYGGETLREAMVVAGLDPDRYREYVRLTEELGGEVASETDATALASVFCTDPAGSGQTYLDGQPLGSYPSDLALVRAYCPEAESQF